MVSYQACRPMGSSTFSVLSYWLRTLRFQLNVRVADAIGLGFFGERHSNLHR